MAKLLQCLQSLPANMILRDLGCVPSKIGKVDVHIARVENDPDGFEIRKERRQHGRELTAVGVIGGPIVYRQMDRP